MVPRSRALPPEVPLDCRCPLAMACLTVLSPSLAERVRRLDEADEAEAMAVRADVEALAALLRTEG